MNKPSYSTTSKHSNNYSSTTLLTKMSITSIVVLWILCLLVSVLRNNFTIIIEAILTKLSFIIIHLITSKLRNSINLYSMFKKNSKNKTNKISAHTVYAAPKKQNSSSRPKHPKLCSITMESTSKFCTRNMILFGHHVWCFPTIRWM